MKNSTIQILIKVDPTFSEVITEKIMNKLLRSVTRVTDIEMSRPSFHKASE